ncbi:MAG: TonB family protein [Bacteroidales bacterium]|nr:TonB family protein [Bacteroidales bacterium]
MNAFTLYLLKSTLLLAVFDAFFLLVMRRSGWFRFNRIVLLAGSAACLLLPLIPIHVSVPTVYSVWLEPAVIGAGGLAAASETIDSSTRAAAAVPWPAMALAVYVLGAAVALGSYVRSYGAMFRLLRRNPGGRRDGYTLHLVDREIPSFSWMRHIAVNRDDYARYPAIFTHERAHVRCGHSVDLLLVSLLTVFQWFNPLVWICRGELKLLHEYEADDFVLNQGIDATQYQLLLVKKAVGEKRFLLANGFNHAQLKNRITMMQTPTKAAWKKLFLLLLLPLMAGTMLLLAECSASPQEEIPASEEAVPDNPYSVIVTDEPAAENVSESEADKAVPFALVEAKPQFDGGDANRFSHWVNEHLHYPEEAKDLCVQGRVTLQFTVEQDGSVTGVRVLRGVHPILDAEAQKVVSQSPKWEPGKIDGKPVRVVYNFPVVFQLK